MRLPQEGARLIWIGRLHALLLLLLLLTPSASSDDESSVIAPLASQSLILDGTMAGDAIVVVGERGHILKSVDQGRSWQQVIVPTRATLTAVTFIDAKNGFAVGHDALILRSQNGGQSWQRMYHAPEEERPLLDVYMHSQTRSPPSVLMASTFIVKTAERLGIRACSNPLILVDSHYKPKTRRSFWVIYTLIIWQFRILVVCT